MPSPKNLKKFKRIWQIVQHIRRKLLVLTVKYELSNLSHSGVQELPPGFPGPFSVYLVFSLPKPEREGLARPRVWAPASLQAGQEATNNQCTTRRGINSRSEHGGASKLQVSAANTLGSSSDDKQQSLSTSEEEVCTLRKLAHLYLRELQSPGH